MRTLHLLSHKKKGTMEAGEPIARSQKCLSHDFGAQDVLVWWDTAHTSKNFSQEQYCLATEVQSFRDAYASLVHNVAFVPIQGRTLYQWLEGGDTLSAWWTSLLFEKHPHMLPALFPLAKLYALGQIVQAMQMQGQKVRLVLHFHDIKVQEVLEGYCAQKHIPFEVRSPAFLRVFRQNILFSECSWEKVKCFFTQKHFWQKNIYKKLPYALQAGLGLLRWVWRWRKSLFSSVPPCAFVRKKQATVVSYFPHIHQDKAQEGYFRSQYYESLHDVLEEKMQEGGLQLHWLLVFVHSAQYDHATCVALKESFQQKALDEKRPEAFYFVEDFLQIKDVLATVWRHICLAWRSWRLEKIVAAHLQLEHMPLWPYLQDAWRESFQGWRGLERCLQRKAFLAYAQRFHDVKFPIDTKHAWTLFPFENCPWERMLTAVMHENTFLGKVYAYQHSCVRTADFRYFDAPTLFEEASCAHFLPDVYALNGQGAYAALKNYLPAQKIYLVEALRYGHLAKKQLPLLLSEKYTHLYVFTSYFSQEVEAHMQIFATWYAQYGQSWKVYIKAHPHCSVLPFLKRNVLDTEHIVVIQDSVEAILHTIGQRQQQEAQGSIVWLSNSTTVALEAAHGALPCMVHGAENHFDMCPLASMVKVRSVEDVQAFLQRPQISCVDEKYFYQDVSLIRWKTLLHLA